MTSEQSAFEALRLAQTHEHLGRMPSSAKLCALDAERAFNAGNFKVAHRHVLRSLAYSVGILSNVYDQACALAGLPAGHWPIGVF